MRGVFVGIDKQDLSGADPKKRPSRGRFTLLRKFEFHPLRRRLKSRKNSKKSLLLPDLGKSSGMGLKLNKVIFGLLELRLRSEVAELQKSLLLTTRKSNFGGLELFFSKWSISQRN